MLFFHSSISKFIKQFIYSGEKDTVVLSQLMEVFAELRTPQSINVPLCIGLPIFFFSQLFITF